MAPREEHENPPPSSWSNGAHELIHLPAVAPPGRGSSRCGSIVSAPSAVGARPAVIRACDAHRCQVPAQNREPTRSYLCFSREDLRMATILFWPSGNETQFGTAVGKLARQTRQEQESTEQKEQEWEEGTGRGRPARNPTIVGDGEEQCLALGMRTAPSPSQRPQRAARKQLSGSNAERTALHPLIGPQHHHPSCLFLAVTALTGPGPCPCALPSLTEIKLRPGAATLCVHVCLARSISGLFYTPSVSPRSAFCSAPQGFTFLYTLATSLVDTVFL